MFFFFFFFFFSLPQFGLTGRTGRKTGSRVCCATVTRAPCRVRATRAGALAARALSTAKHLAWVLARRRGTLGNGAFADGACGNGAGRPFPCSARIRRGGQQAPDTWSPKVYATHVMLRNRRNASRIPTVDVVVRDGMYMVTHGRPPCVAPRRMREPNTKSRDSLPATSAPSGTPNFASYLTVHSPAS